MAKDRDSKNLPAETKPGEVAPIRPGQIIDRALENLTPAQKQELLGKAADEALNLEIKAREMRLDSEQSRHDIQAHIDVSRSLDQSGNMNRQNISSEIKTGSGRMKIESKSGWGCFVATAAFSNPEHYVVRSLQAFRDEALLASRPGRSFISWYYRIGPKLAARLEGRHLIRRVIRGILWIVALAARGYLYVRLVRHANRK